MAAHKIQLKLYADGSTRPELDAFIPVLHRFIRDQVLTGEVPIDVADYGHVQDGPGVVLIGHESDYYLDQGEGRLGLLYSKKRGADAGELGASLVEAFRRALRVAGLLEDSGAEQARVQFRTDEVLVRFNDRLNASNTPEYFAEVRPALESALTKVYGSGFELLREGSPKDLFTVRVKAARAPRVSELAARLAQ